MLGFFILEIYCKYRQFGQLFDKGNKLYLRYLIGFRICFYTAISTQKHLPRGIPKDSFSKRFFEISTKKVLFKEVAGLKQDSFISVSSCDDATFDVF